MEISKFVEQFAELFEETDASEFAADTKFKELGEWNSLIALSVIAMVNEEYDIIMKGQDIEQSTTIQDIFDAVKSRR